MLALVLAGCLGGTKLPDGVDDALPTIPWSVAALASDHEHADLILHEDLSTDNFEVIGYEPLIGEDYGTTTQGNLCGDVSDTRDGRRLAVVESRGDVAFSVSDVTDATNPRWLGELVMRRTYVYDVGAVPDGKHVVLVTTSVKDPDRPTAGALDEPEIEWRSPCAEGGWRTWHTVPSIVSEDPVPRPSSLVLVSIADPANPVIVDQRPLPNSGHSVSAWDVDGRTWVVASALLCVPGAGCPHLGATFHFYEILDSAAGGKLSPLAVYNSPLPTEVSEYPTSNGHNDAWILKHPKTGQTLAWLAHGDMGLVILDLADPRQPKFVSQWTDFDPNMGPNDSGNFHSLAPLTYLINDRHYTVTGPEFGGKPSVRPTGVVWALDTTNPALPKPVGAWTLPHDVKWDDFLQFSTHYLTVTGTTAFVSAYHAGIWAIDLSNLTDEFQLLPSIGAFLPDKISPEPPQKPFRWTPTVEDVLAFDDGILFTFDSNSGLYAFRFHADQPAEPPQPWWIEAPPGA